jgi:hypothetical protein
VSFANYHTVIDGLKAIALPSEQCQGQLSSKSSHRSFGGRRKALLQGLLLWGNSSGIVWNRAFHRSRRTSSKRVDFEFQGACPPSLDVRNPGSTNCRHFDAKVVEKTKTGRRDTIVMVTSWLKYSIPQAQHLHSSDARRQRSSAAFEHARHHTIAAIRPFTSRTILITATLESARAGPFFSLSIAEWRLDIAPPAAMCLAHFRKRSTWFWKVAEYYRDDRPLRLDDPGSCFCSSRRPAPIARAYLCSTRTADSWAWPTLILLPDNSPPNC